MSDVTKIDRDEFDEWCKGRWHWQRDFLRGALGLNSMTARQKLAR